jgi:hypothetical protein
MDTKTNSFALQTHRPVDARLQRDLRDQFDGVVEFADFCAFLAPASVGQRAQELIDLARGLYEDTLHLLEQRGHDE